MTLTTAHLSASALSYNSYLRTQCSMCSMSSLAIHLNCYFEFDCTANNLLQLNAPYKKNKGFDWNRDKMIECNDSTVPFDTKSISLKCSKLLDSALSLPLFPLFSNKVCWEWFAFHSIPFRQMKTFVRYFLCYSFCFCFSLNTCLSINRMSKLNNEFTKKIISVWCISVRCSCCLKRTASKKLLNCRQLQVVHHADNGRPNNQPTKKWWSGMYLHMY